MKLFTFLTIAVLAFSSLDHVNAQIIKVPADYSTIAIAVQNASGGDTIVLSPGTYNEKNITISKPVTISSEWIYWGNEDLIDQTIINCSGSILFTVNSDDVEISGLKIINGDHTLDMHARTSVKYNHMYDNLDPVSMESGGGGYVGYNLIENNGSGDDCIDLDINQTGSDILIEYNKLFNANDDGIEIRLFTQADQNIHYEISHNVITGSKNAGIQLISYDVYTGKVFSIHHNVLRDCKIGLGCMGGQNSSEDMSGTSKMDETVYFYNNTSVENQMGATGGNTMLAMNNIASGNSIGGFKLFGANSVIANNLLYNNQGNDFIEIDTSAVQYDNIISTDPLLDGATQRPLINSPCIDAGMDTLNLEESAVIVITPEEYLGSAPDIGALEYDVHLSSGRSFVEEPEDLYISNYPNPFTLNTTIRVNIPRAGNVEISVFDMTGRKILILDEGYRAKGVYRYEWPAGDENGARLPAGLYTARMKAAGISSVAKMLLLR